MFGHKADVSVRRRVLPRVHAKELDLACTGSKFPHEEFEQGGFSCAIHPEDAGHTAAQAKRDVAQCMDAAVGFRYPVEVDHGGIGRRQGSNLGSTLLGHVRHHSRVTSIEATREESTYNARAFIATSATSE